MSLQRPLLPNQTYRAVAVCLLVSLYLILMWWIYLYPYKAIAYDSPRDLGVVWNLLEGNYTSDPVVKGESFWYPPLFHASVAVASRILRVEPHSVLVYLPVLIFLTFPSAIYFWSRQFCSEEEALLATVITPIVWPMVVRWIVLPLPFTVGLTWMVIGFGLYLKWQALSGSRILLWGLWLAVGIWLHTLVAAVLLAAVWADQTYRLLRDGVKAFSEVKAQGFAALTGVVLGVPLYPFLFRTKLNLAPERYFSAHVWEADAYQLDSRAYWLILAIVGLVSLQRRQKGRRLLMLYISLAAIMTFHPMLQKLTSIEIWWLVPHEFLIMLQIGLGITSAKGLWWVLKRIRVRNLPTPLLATFLLLIAIAPNLYLFSNNILLKPISSEIPSPEWRKVRDWIQNNTHITDVILCNQAVAYFHVNAQTGRKVVAVGDTHMNPSIRASILEGVQAEMLATTNRKRFEWLAEQTEVAYVLLKGDEFMTQMKKWTGWDCFRRIPDGGQEWFLFAYGN